MVEQKRQKTVTNTGRMTFNIEKGTPLVPEIGKQVKE